MPEQARRHHVVSNLYLRYFADERDRVATVMLPGDRAFTQNIANASVQTNFYTVIDNDGRESGLAEQALSQIETLAADAWRELAAGCGRSLRSTGSPWPRGWRCNSCAVVGCGTP